jgi:hypothetical protein
MGTMISYPKYQANHSIPEAVEPDPAAMGKEYRDAVAGLFGIARLSPRIAHQFMRKIISVYRSLALIADGETE